MSNARIFGQWAIRAIFVVVALAAPMSAVVAAQNRPGPSVDLAAGWVGFADDGL